MGDQMNDAPLMLEYLEVTASRDILQGDLGRMLEVDPGGGAVVLTCPALFGAGFNFTVRQVGPGSVSFVAGAGASLVSLTGAAPTITGQWAAVTVDNRSGTEWVVIGDIV
jgi:hypothetical protein